MNLAALFAAATFLLDGLLVAFAFILAYILRFQTGWIPADSIPPLSGYEGFLAVVVPSHWLVFKYAGLYRQRRGITGVDEFPRILSGTVLAAVLVAASTFLIRSFSYSRLVIGMTILLATLLLWGGRGLLRRVQISLRRAGWGLTRLLVVGTGETARTVLARVKAHPELGYQLVGAVSERPGKREVEGVRVVGFLSRLPELASRYRVPEVLFALPASEHARLIPLLVKLQDSPVRYKIVSDLFGIVTNPLETDVLLGMPVFEMKEAPLARPFNRFLKRSFDVVASSAGILILTALPVLPLMALMVKLSSPGPVFYRQKRVGKDGKVFDMLKFRSMTVGGEKGGLTRKNDSRVTKVGRVIRKTSFDELPQLFNVLFGQMSLVGPRPEVVGHEYDPSIPRYFERHPVKPGITGWAQVNGFRGDSSLEERVKYDIYYIENWSLWLDMKIILRTALDLLEHRHAY